MLLSRRRFELRAVPPDRKVSWHLISREPHMVYVVGSRWEVLALQKILRGTRTLFVRGANWVEEGRKPAERWRKYHDRARRFFPEHDLVFANNTATARDEFRRQGLTAIHCHHNALLDENVFRILPDVPREFDAVYTAQPAPFKRHELAVMVDNLALITYRAEFEPEHYEKVRAWLPDAHWLNYASGEFRFMSPREVAGNLNRSRVGLILSAEEGGNRATAEYLLCGLPVVSTESRGGREFFFEDEFVETVAATPAAVAEGVRRMIERSVDREDVRARTLAKMMAHRDVFIERLQRFADEEGVERDMKAEWPEYYVNGMRIYRPVRMLVDILAGREPADVRDRD